MARPRGTRDPPRLQTSYLTQSTLIYQVKPGNTHPGTENHRGHSFTAWWPSVTLLRIPPPYLSEVSDSGPTTQLGTIIATQNSNTRHAGELRRADTELDLRGRLHRQGPRRPVLVWQLLFGVVSSYRSNLTLADDFLFFLLSILPLTSFLFGPVPTLDMSLAIGRGHWLSH